LSKIDKCQIASKENKKTTARQLPQLDENDVLRRSKKTVEKSESRNTKLESRLIIAKN